MDNFRLLQLNGVLEVYKCKNAINNMWIAPHTFRASFSATSLQLIWTISHSSEFCCSKHNSFYRVNKDVEPGPGYGPPRCIGPYGFQQKQCPVPQTILNITSISVPFVFDTLPENFFYGLNFILTCKSIVSHQCSSSFLPFTIPIPQSLLNINTLRHLTTIAVT